MRNFVNKNEDHEMILNTDTIDHQEISISKEEILNKIKNNQNVSSYVNSKIETNPILENFLEINFDVLKENLRNVCKCLNYENPTEIQKLVLQNIYARDNRDNLILKYKAGSGKTFAFILCLMRDFDFALNKLQSIIILPTRELALQTAEYFDIINNSLPNNLPQKIKKFNYQILIGGDQDINQTQKKKKNIPKILNETQIIIGTIGKIQKLFKNKVNNEKTFNPFKNLKTVILDEADKLIYQNKNNVLHKILNGINRFKNKNNILNKETNKNNSGYIRFILSSASLDENTKNFYTDIIKKEFFILQAEKKSFEIDQSTNFINSENKISIKDNNIADHLKYEKISSNIKEYYFVFKNEERTTYFENKYTKLIFILDSLKNDFKQALIFYNQKGKGEELAADLRDHGWYATTFIHGDLSQDQRLLLYKKIKNLEIKLIISTDLFARGIDLRTVDLVINFDCPYNKVEYHHRVGRTGRYNSLGNSITFFQENQIAILNDIKNDDIDKLIEIKSIDQELIELLKKDYLEISSANKFDYETNRKLDQINLFIPKNNLNEENETFLRKKRRRIQYEKESLISGWVDSNEKLYDEERFFYLDQRNLENEEEISKEKIDKKENLKQNFTCSNKYNLSEKFCLYCDFFKIFELENKN